MPIMTLPKPAAGPDSGPHVPSLILVRVTPMSCAIATNEAVTTLAANVSPIPITRLRIGTSFRQPRDHLLHPSRATATSSHPLGTFAFAFPE